MGWLSRTAKRAKRGRSVAAGNRVVDDGVTAHLTEFARTRRGVEAYVEPRTSVTQVTLLLVAYDGEWTRRRVPSPQAAHEFANQLGIPSYDAGVVGYPQRKRDYDARQAALRKRDLGS